MAEKPFVSPRRLKRFFMGLLGEKLNTKEEIIANTDVKKFAGAMAVQEMFQDVDDRLKDGLNNSGVVLKTAYMDEAETNGSGIVALRNKSGNTMTSAKATVLAAYVDSFVDEYNQVNTVSLGFSTNGYWIARITNGSGEPYANKKVNLMIVYTSALGMDENIPL